MGSGGGGRRVSFERDRKDRLGERMASLHCWSAVQMVLFLICTLPPFKCRQVQYFLERRKGA